MEFKSQELQSIESRSADILSNPARLITHDQLKSSIEEYFVCKDYSLLKHFTQGHALGVPAATSEDVMISMIKCVRAHFANQIRSDEANYHERLIIIDKIFDSIKNLIDVIAIHNIKVNKTELLATMIGNMLKSLT